WAPRQRPNRNFDNAANTTTAAVPSSGPRSTRARNTRSERASHSRITQITSPTEANPSSRLSRRHSSGSALRARRSISP
ncbi:hypothetical protein ABK046_51940, partial [Streptomyces caeruleatus]